MKLKQGHCAHMDENTWWTRVLCLLK